MNPRGRLPVLAVAFLLVLAVGCANNNAAGAKLTKDSVAVETPTLVTAASAAATPTASPTRNAGACPENSLRAAAVARAFALGVGGLNQNDLYMVRDSGARDTLRCAANIVTDNGFYWGTVEPKHGQFNFSRGDEMLNYAQANGLAVRGHVLVWHNSLPAWLVGGNFTPEQLRAS